MTSSHSAKTFSVAMLAILGVSCSSTPPSNGGSGGSGGRGVGSGGASGGTIATSSGSKAGSGGATNAGAGGNGLGGNTSGGAGGSGRGGAGVATSGGAGGSGSGGAGNGGVGAGGATGSGAGGSGAGGMTGDAGIDAAADAAGASGTELIPGSGSLCSSTAAGTGAKVITVDGKSAGRIFDAIGGLSGGGGTSRLLYDYPPQQQSEVLDYLFKPGYGAALHLLKVEIGSDTDTTNGAEASHQRTATDRNYKRGYEWWLMEEAKKRNPAIKLYALEWGAPGWLGKGIYTSANITYLVDWITNAQSVHGLIIDYIGGWNEEGGSGNASWFVQLKSALRSAGLSTKIVAADQAATWAVATSMKNDATYAGAVDILGAHYLCGYLSNGTDCGGTSNLSDAIASGKPLWASEEGSEAYDSGAMALARMLNRHYIQAKVTASINWSLVGSWYSNLPFAGVDGLMLANEPWTGHYVVERSIWANAHTTQFVRPGWQYLDTGSAMVSGVGSYVALKSPTTADWSVVLETEDASAATTFQFVETGGIFQGPVHVWATDMSSSKTSDWFIRQPDIVPSGCQFTFTAQPKYLYSFSSTGGQGKGDATPPASKAMPLPYADDFESYTVGAMPNIPKYMSAMQGAFEVERCVGGRSGQCVQQELNAEPTGWIDNGTVVPDPVTIGGDPGWTNYKVSVDALLQQAGSVDLIGRIVSQSEDAGGVEGYHLIVSDTGAWTLVSQDAGMSNSRLASGTVTVGTSSWHTLALSFQGSTIVAQIDGTTVATVTSGTYAKGNIGLSTSKWNNAQFDNLSITAQ